MELQFPLPPDMYERATKELQEDHINSIINNITIENRSACLVVCRIINGLDYEDFWVKK